MNLSFRKNVTRLAVVGLVGASLALTIPTHAQAPGKIYGVAFIDSNANGRRDPGEPTTLGRFKVTNGGSYFRCGHTGRDTPMV
jgi:hypothetical protein